MDDSNGYDECVRLSVHKGDNYPADVDGQLHRASIKPGTSVGSDRLFLRLSN